MCVCVGLFVCVLLCVYVFECVLSNKKCVLVFVSVCVCELPRDLVYVFV